MNKTKKKNIVQGTAFVKMKAGVEVKLVKSKERGSGSSSVEEHHKYTNATTQQKLSEATRSSRRGRDKFSLKLPEGLSPASIFTLHFWPQSCGWIHGSH
jgi:hypothetical protein